MNLYAKSLALKIGAFIIFAEVVVLTFVGFILINRLSSGPQQTLQRTDIINLLLVSGILIIGSTAVTLYFAFRWLIFNRITAVLAVLKSAESGDLQSRIDEPILNDEVGQLQQGINSLIAQLQNTVNDLKGNISVLRLTEAALRENEELYRVFVEGTDDLITQVDNLGNFIYINHTAEKIFGLPQEELIGRSAFDFVHPDDREATKQAFQGWLQSNVSSITYENRQVSQTGAVASMLWTINVHHDQYGQVNYMNSIARDITDLKASEAQLQLLSTALEAAANGIVITDRDGRIYWVNAALTQLTGYTKEELIGQLTNIFKSGQQNSEFYRSMWNAVLSGNVWNGELINRRKDGSIYIEEMTITPVFNTKHEVTHFIAIKQDISERKQAELQYRSRAASLELIAQVGRRTTAILELDELLNQAVHLISDTFSYYNVVIRLLEDDYVVLKATSLSSLKPLEGKQILKRGQGITGWVAQHGEPLLAPDISQEPRYHAELSSMETNSEVAVPIKLKGAVIGVLDAQSVQFEAFDEDDVFTLQAIAAQLAVAIENARLYKAAQQEIIERRIAEEKLKIYTAELERSNNELQNFAYVSSHDLQEPLRKIQMFGDRLIYRYRDHLDERGQDYLDRMQNAASRMQTLIEDLLAFSRVITKSQPFTRVRLTQIVEEVVGDLEGQLKDVNGRVELNHLPIIKADPTQMRQLFQNLISNGLKYHRPEGSPVVKIWSEVNESGTVTIYIADNGIGFDEKYLDRIFNVFQRLHGRSTYEGTGVGLAICKRIVERHNGHLTARSKKGDGATFIVTLPENPDEQPETKP